MSLAFDEISRELAHVEELARVIQWTGEDFRDKCIAR